MDPSNPSNNGQPQGGVTIPADAVGVLIIVMNQAGQINVQGCIDNKLMAVGLLEIAKDSVFRYHDEQAKNNAKRIVAPPLGMDGNRFRQQ